MSAEGAKIEICQFNFKVILMIKSVKEMVYFNAHYSALWRLMG